MAHRAEQNDVFFTFSLCRHIERNENDNWKDLFVMIKVLIADRIEVKNLLRKIDHLNEINLKFDWIFREKSVNYVVERDDEETKLIVTDKKKSIWFCWRHRCRATSFVNPKKIRFDRILSAEFQNDFNEFFSRNSRQMNAKVVFNPFLFILTNVFCSLIVKSVEMNE